MGDRLAARLCDWCLGVVDDDAGLALERGLRGNRLSLEKARETPSMSCEERLSGEVERREKLRVRKDGEMELLADLKEAKRGLFGVTGS